MGYFALDAFCKLAKLNLTGDLINSRSIVAQIVQYL